MFGITPQPQRNSAGRITSNLREEIRRGSSSSTYDSAAAEQMKMEHLRKERERREKERNKMLYDSKRREYDQISQEYERIKSESRRLEAELVKHTHDTESLKLLQARTVGDLGDLKKEALDLTQKIQKVEAELLMYKNKHQQIIQRITHAEQSDKSIIADKHKREAYVSELERKHDIITRKLEEDTKHMERLKMEVDQLKKLI